ncbi:DUF4843 domain-containing protein [Pedobacter sp. AW31-3R]|uniref:DUF4843 domain-containing protein n=1 Tax=Pedobacter sp. AW31-3R TaxID=3445781 RepID=UPI003F9EF1C5
MKHINFIILALLIFSGCKKSELQLFREETPLLNIWLGTNSVVQDSLTHNFAYTSGNRDAITFYYRIAGYAVDYDRTFELSTSDDDARLVNFTFGSYVVPAGKYEGSFILYVDKPEDMDVFTQRDLKVTFTLKQTDLFQPSTTNYKALRIKFKNAIAKPENWETAVSPYFPLKTYFGTYSDAKYRFIIQTTGLSNFSVYSTIAINPVLPENTITTFNALALKIQCKVALEQYNAEHDTDLLDENGNPIVFP